MPELPEVETIRRDLDKEISGFQIDKIEILAPKSFLTSNHESLDLLQNKKIKSVDRKGKYLIFRISNSEHHMLAHLRMTGKFLLEKNSMNNDIYTKILFSISNEDGERKVLKFTDIRTFGFIRLLSSNELDGILSKLGPEPLKDLDLKAFKEILLNSHRSVKTVLLDQSKIAGIGNIYANEALFYAKIDPRKQASQLSPNNVKRLFENLEDVLKIAIDLRGASDNNYRDIYNQKGYFQEKYRVYRRQGKPCFNCGHKILRIVIGQRGTFYCPKCQK